MLFDVRVATQGGSSCALFCDDWDANHGITFTAMPRKRINGDFTPGRFPPGTLRRVTRALIFRFTLRGRGKRCTDRMAATSTVTALNR